MLEELSEEAQKIISVGDIVSLSYEASEAWLRMASPDPDLYIHGIVLAVSPDALEAKTEILVKWQSEYKERYKTSELTKLPRKCPLPEWYFKVEKSRILPIEKIRLDGGTQSRAQINQATVDEYSEAMNDGVSFSDDITEIQAGKAFPPIIVYYDGTDYWLADGFHRVAACQSAFISIVLAEIKQGTRRDAVLASCGANATHGLRRTNADKQRAVMTLLEDEEWSQWSNRHIARACNVSDPFVWRLRDKITSNIRSDNGNEERKYIDRWGKEQMMNTGKIHKSKSSRLDSAPEPKEFSSVKAELKDKAQSLGLPTSSEQVLPDIEEPLAPHEADNRLISANEVNLRAIANGSSTWAVAAEIAIGLKHLSEDEIGWMIENSAHHGLKLEQLKAIRDAADQQIKFLLED